MTLDRLLAATAIALGVLAAAFGPPSPPRSISPVELATWLRDGKNHLRVIDLRPAEAFDADHVTRAESMSLAAIPQASFESTDTIVMYSDAEAACEKAAAALRARGLNEVYVLHRGLAGWLEDVMYPVISASASPEEREAFTKIAELSRFFGGSPRVGDRAAGSSAAETATRIKRRGC